MLISFESILTWVWHDIFEVIPDENLYNVTYYKVVKKKYCQSYTYMLFELENKLLNCNQSSFTQADSRINKLVNICTKILCQIDNDDEVLTVFLDLTKIFHKNLVYKLRYKLKKIGITGNSCSKRK